MIIFSTVFTFIRKPLGIATVAIVIIGLGFVIFSSGSASPTTAIVERGTVVAGVTVTGTTKAATTLNLSFARAGTISHVYAPVGTRVTKGQLLAELSRADLAAQLAEAEASVAVAQANLTELERGTRPESLAISKEKRVGAARTLEDVIRSGYGVADSAIRTSADQMFSNAGTISLTLSLFPPNQLRSNAENTRILLEKELKDVNATLVTLDEFNDDSLISSSAVVRDLLSATSNFLDQLTLLLSGSLINTSLSQATIDGYRADISSARSSVNQAQESLTSALVAYSVAVREYDLDVAGATPEDITAQKATVAQARAKADSARAELNKALIYSPIAGTITRQDAKVGEYAPANTALITVQTDGSFEIEANVPEADIAKLTIGNTAAATVDAFVGEPTLPVRIVSIDPAETLIDGVSTYRVIFHFEGSTMGIRPGMSVTLAITTNQREDALKLPARFVSIRNGKKFVSIIADDESTREVEVTTGLRGSDGTIEILSGLSEGDRVATPVVQ